MRRIRIIMLVVLQVVAVMATAAAAPISFTFTTTGAGTWEQAGGATSSFGLSTLIEVTLVADTAELQDPMLAYPGGNPVAGTIGYGVGTTVTGTLAVAGVTVGTFANPLYLFRNGPVLGFGDSVDFDVFGGLGGFATYDLVSAYGPVSVTPYFPGLTTMMMASGDKVMLTALSQAYGVTFEAALLPDAPAVPEPATLGLLLTGLAALPLAGKRRRARGAREAEVRTDS